MEENIADVQKYYDLIADFLVEYSFQLLGAIVVLLIGLWIAKKVGIWINNLCLRHHVDVTLANFLANMVKIAIIVMVVIMTLNQLGIAITPFVAAIGAASLGAGLAFQGMLSNYAAGLTIILTRLFTIGNTIRVQGVHGVVKEINLATTLLENEDGELILIPNKHIVGEIVHNSAAARVIEAEVGVAYDTDIDKALAVIREAIAQTDDSQDKANNNDNEATESDTLTPNIGIDRFDDSAIVIGYRVWVPSLSFFERKYALNKAVIDALRRENIQIPFPQRVVHQYKDPAS
ncbi:mechanosensitive ion channel family protein [Corallincola spongiicola]|uniref:Small-conductance mechanosensitive channel n=1 Tax=Corallincola spongiicola TaxID=2520508 RepID=A0ABY1WTR3_9GAMM|nr:mechanosensitive ion channel family protein [Corallincola spongiicola]TAA47961.1 mechanosensitive ion channel family protein [Corallincola spongiicola]